MGNSDGSDMTRLARNPPFNVLVSTLHPKVRQVYWHCSFVFRLYDSCQDSRYQLNAYLTRLMRHIGKDMGHGDLEGLFIITDDASNPVAQGFDRLKQTGF